MWLTLVVTNQSSVAHPWEEAELRSGGGVEAAPAEPKSAVEAVSALAQAAFVETWLTAVALADGCGAYAARRCRLNTSCLTLG